MGERARSGYVLFEVLVAAAVAVLLIVLLMRMGTDRTIAVADVIRDERALDVARAVLAEASRRDALVPGERTGRVGEADWRVVVTPTDCVAPAGAPTGHGACPRGGWILHRIRVVVSDDHGRRADLETWRLGRVGG